MCKGPLISIIIPVFNTEKYLRECLDSITNQTYLDLEIICVNDGSTDTSLDILNDYASKDSRIVIINQANQGPLIARNNGLKNMHGEYFIFIDSDDILKKDAITTLYDLMKRDNTKIAFTNFYSENKLNYNFEDTLLSVDDVLTDIANCKSKMFPCWGLLISNCYIDYEFRGYRLCEDELYALDLFVDADKVSFSPTPVITYRNKERAAIVPKDFDFYYQGYQAAKFFYELVGETRPQLQNYAKCRLLMHSFYCFFNGNRNNPPIDKLNHMKDTIKEHRKDVIKNTKASFTIRAIACLSYLGLGFTTAVFRFYAKFIR